MAQFIPTKSQQQALDAEGSDILVSASAGSGKTTILVDRIVQKLLAGQDINHLLIVTFTDAAAREMKQRLTKRIQQQVQLTDDMSTKQHLYRQLALLPGAYISTLHAFCLQVIRKFYYLIDLDPTFRLLSDDNERFLLKERAWKKVRNSYYRQDDEQFFQLEDNFVSGNSEEAMEELVFKVVDFAVTTPNPASWINQLPKIYEVTADLSQSNFYQENLLDILTNKLKFIHLQSQQAIAYVKANEQLVKYQDSAVNLEKQLAKVIAQLPHLLWDDLRQLIYQLSPLKGQAQPKTDPEIIVPFSDLKDSIKDQLHELQYKLFALDNEQWVQISNQSKQLVAKLVQVATQFMEQFRLEKQAQHSLDFNDLEHYTMQILQTTNNGQSLAQQYYRHQFTELLVDEYQDTNPLQEAIIQEIRQPQPGNLFMVGDVKQSIYGFRQAAPWLFVHKYQQMQHDLHIGQLINLSENFRSANNVIASVNGIFERIMDHQIGELDYTSETRLVNGIKFPDELDTTTEVLLYQKAHLPAQLTNEQAQIKLIIKRIQQMFTDNYQVFDRHSGKTRNLRYSDIVILTRVKNLNNDLVNLFAQAKLPIVVADAANYFQTTEIQTMLAMLKIIDNPRQDIALVAVLRSMIGGLKENELAYLRINSRTGDYYQALINYLADSSYNQKNEFARSLTIKVQHFMKQLKQFRDQAPKMSIAELIWQIYLQTGYLSYVQGMPNGRQRSANLHDLYQRAEQFEQMEFKGLFQFIHFIEHIQNNQKDLAQPIEFKQQSNEVTVMTIHGSKGLEFPVVFMLNLDHQFNNEDQRKKYLLDNNLGIGIKYLDPYTHIIYETLPLYTAKAIQKKKSLSEETRLLYVALTRAQQKLILVGATKKSPEEEWNSWQLPEAISANKVLDVSLRLKFNSFQTMLQYVWGINGVFKNNQVVPNSQSAFDFRVDFPTSEELTFSVPKKQATVAKTNPQSVSHLFEETTKKILQLDYPYQAATETTAYQSVSEIKHLFANPDDQNLPVIDLQKPKGNRYILDDFVRPRFLTANKTAVTPADIGSATHLLLQKIDLQHTPQISDFKQLAQTLVQQQLLSVAVSKQINYSSLEQFYQSSFGQQIIHQQASLKREWAFSMLMAASQLFKTSDHYLDDQILIHGIIDGLFVDQTGQIIIFDYKTDYVDPKALTGLHSLQQVLHEYSGQLNLYQQAVEQITQQKVSHKYLCLLSINQVIEVK